jgi:hypothetical protein
LEKFNLGENMEKHGHQLLLYPAKFATAKRVVELGKRSTSCDKIDGAN